MPKKGQRITGRHARGKERPHTWLVGPDAYKHSMYIPFLKMRAQAKFRGEDFELQFEEFYTMWNGNWHLRGRGTNDLVLARIDWEEGWDSANIHLITRNEQCQRQGEYKQSKRALK
jgi:hypothetical protein